MFVTLLVCCHLFFRGLSLSLVRYRIKRLQPLQPIGFAVWDLAAR